jgi:coenzyme PQQ precursor peptide PqqA
MNTPKRDWTRPQVEEQQVGLEATSYLPAEIDTPDVMDPDRH